MEDKYFYNETPGMCKFNVWIFLNDCYLNNYFCEISFVQ